MHEAGRVEGALARGRTEPMVRDLTQALVDDGEQPIERLRIAITPTLEQRRDLRLLGGHCLPRSRIP